MKINRVAKRLATWVLATAGAGAAFAEEPPNIVLIVADDLGGA